MEKSLKVSVTQLGQHNDDVPCEVKCGSITLDEICVHWGRIVRPCQVQVANSILSTAQCRQLQLLVTIQDAILTHNQKLT